jgi:hypothetical protein
MFDTPDIVSPTLICGTVTLIVLGLMFLGGLIPTVRIIMGSTDHPLRKKLLLSVGSMSIGALGMVFLCVLLAQWTLINDRRTSHRLDGYICLETPITAQYKMVITRLRSGEESARAVDLDGKTQIYSIDRFAVVGNYLIGETDDNDFFWFDLKTGGRRYLNNEDEFLESLGLLGISKAPEFLSVGILCETQGCKPCVP